MQQSIIYSVRDWFSHMEWISSWDSHWLYVSSVSTQSFCPSDLRGKINFELKVFWVGWCFYSSTGHPTDSYHRRWPFQSLYPPLEESQLGSWHTYRLPVYSLFQASSCSQRFLPQISILSPSLLLPLPLFTSSSTQFPLSIHLWWLFSFPFCVIFVYLPLGPSYYSVSLGLWIVV